MIGTEHVEIGSPHLGRSHLIPARITLNVSGKCRLAQLGRTAVSYVQVVNLIKGTITVKEAVYVAANGDELRAEHTNVTASTDTKGNATFTGLQTYTGGTGRFENARGSVSLGGGMTAPDLTGRSTGFYALDGRIEYDVSNRSDH